MKADVNGYLYAGGFFTDFTGFSPNHIARWKDLKWTVLGNGANAYISALAVNSQNRILAAGDFNTVGGFTTHKIAGWDGQEWKTMVLPAFERIFDLKVGAGDVVYAAAEANTGNKVYSYTAPLWNPLGDPA